jgi:uncharacterized protein YggE
MKLGVWIFAAGTILATSVPADEALASKRIPHQGGGGCTMQENVSLSVNFNIRAKSFQEAKKKYEEKMQQLDTFAKQQNIQKFDLQSMNYSINSQQISYDDGMPEQGYQLSGNASYQLDSADNAFKLGEFLTQQKFQINVNVNKYRNGVCDNNSVTE